MADSGTQTQPDQLDGVRNAYSALAKRIESLELHMIRLDTLNEGLVRDLHRLNAVLAGEFRLVPKEPGR